MPHALVPVSTLLFNRNISFVEELGFTGVIVQNEH